ncbi:hypothetical protein FRC04_006725 [Tulasnella sp. 424]|nr:hypothetical protein FRC04_006725 [Tulasnella sp. 424]KAG8960592.1 hypothetical protein FRC05_006727 [Tulasnella sp. 425]
MDFPHNLWDLSGTTLPQQITNLDESDFLSILSKQLNPTAAPNQPISAQALAQQINQQQGVSPPVSEESSPSPPTTTNRGLSKSLDAAGAGADGNDMQHKRKKIQRDESDESDSDSDQPPSKSQKEQPGKKGTKRKSTGDEARAMKRKEQNRAAQRAFRERKEKHVKDLEDQVSALEQKSSAQATENENLRELLGRLQNENLMLKQSAFTFNFNSAQTPRSTSTPTVSGSRTTPSTATSPVEKSPSTVPSATPKESNPQQQAGGSNGTGYTPLLSFSSLGSTENLITMGTPPTNPTNSMNASSPPLTFFSPPPTNAVPSPYTTLASNPMYTSYTDFSAWDQFFQNAALDQTLAGVGSDPSLVSQANPPSDRMEDLLTSTDNFSELIPFSSFSPSSGNNNGAGMMTGLSPSGSGNSPIDHVATSAKAASTNNAFSLESREMNTSNRPSLPVRSSSPCGGADPDEAPLPGSSSHNPNMTAMNIAKPNLPPGALEHDGSNCPKSKEDLAKLIEQQPVGTLGTVPGVAGVPSVPQTYSDKKTMKLKEVWNALKQHPRFEECDMDELCRELSSKVKCDGGMPGLDESDKPCEELSKIIEAVKAKKAEEAKAAQQVKQQQRVIQSISTGGLPESSMSRSPQTASANTASPNMLSNFSLFGNSPYNSYLPFAIPQSASSTTSQFTMPPQSASTADFGFDSRRPSLGAAHNSSGSNDASSFMSGSSSNVATPPSQGTNGSTPIMVDQSGPALSQALAGGATDSWLAGAFEMPTSPNSQFLSFLNGGAFSPNSYLNIPADKE